MHEDTDDYQHATASPTATLAAMGPAEAIAHALDQHQPDDSVGAGLRTAPTDLQPVLDKIDRELPAILTTAWAMYRLALKAIPLQGPPATVGKSVALARAHLAHVASLMQMAQAKGTPTDPTDARWMQQELDAARAALADLDPDDIVD